MYGADSAFRMLGTYGWGLGQRQNQMDEVCVWSGYCPTEEEMLFDWNGGTGRGKP